MRQTRKSLAAQKENVEIPAVKKASRRKSFRPSQNLETDQSIKTVPSNNAMKKKSPMRSTSMINKLNLTLDAIAEENSSDYNQVVDRAVGAWVEPKYFDGHKTIWYET